jgi:hypothetical protein
MNSTPGISCQINVKLNQELQLGRIHLKRIPEKSIEKSILPEHFRYGMGQQSIVVMCTSLDELHTRHQLSNNCKTNSRVGEKALEENSRKKYVLSEHFRYGMGQQSTVVMCTYHWINSTPGVSC